MSSPSKQPNGILRTPVTVGKTRKTVSFGEHVVDNEGKRGNVGKSGIPNDCPGKFPSPWTPGTELRADGDGEKRPQTRLTAALLDARRTVQPQSSQKPKAKDDNDLTLDLSMPRSESGKYWKEQYESYAERSEKEVKKLVAKQQLAKNYAKKKDGEVTELITKLEQERKRYRRRELELEQQNKDYQERLRQAMAENFSATVEITALKNRIATLEKSMVAPSWDIPESKGSFQIFEDSGRDSLHPQPEPADDLEASYLSQKARTPPIGKENSPPKPRHVRRQTLPETSRRHTASFIPTPALAVEAVQISTILGRSPYTAGRTLESTTPTIAAPVADHSAKSPLSVRKTDAPLESQLPKSPAQVLPSSPLPQPSPDPWMADVNESSLVPVDRMALPVASGTSYSRPTRPSRVNRHHASKSVAHVSSLRDPNPARRARNSNIPKNEPSSRQVSSQAEQLPAQHQKLEAATSGQAVTERPSSVPAKSDTFQPAKESPTDPKFAVSKLTSHHAEGSSQVKRERVQLLPADRKEEARKRLLARKEKKLSEA